MPVQVPDDATYTGEEIRSAFNTAQEIAVLIVEEIDAFMDLNNPENEFTYTNVYPVEVSERVRDLTALFLQEAGGEVTVSEIDGVQTIQVSTTVRIDDEESELGPEPTAS
jgi:hypothetical protein